jgi:hypothetical protein
MKKRKKIIKKSKLNDFDGFGVYQMIFSYVKENKDVLNLAYVSKAFYKIFDIMKRRSSNHYYQHQFLINDPNRNDYSFDLFSPDRGCLMKYNLDKELYCTNIEEYEKDEYDEDEDDEDEDEDDEDDDDDDDEDDEDDDDEIEEYYGNIGLKEEDIYWKQKQLMYTLLIKILKKVNQKYGMVAMISGGKALEKLTKTKSWNTHFIKIGEKMAEYLYKNKDIQKRIKLPLKLGEKKLLYQKLCGSNDFWCANTNNNDIDVFLLGNNKIKILKEILTEFEKALKNMERKKLICKMVYRRGLLDFYIGAYPSSYYNSAYPPVKTSLTKYIQFIIKENAKSPNDIFTFYDLDCCKIGWFPGLQKVMVNQDFIRSIFTYINCAPFQFKKINDIHIERIRKYFMRTCIRTTIDKPPILSYYHCYREPDMSIIKRLFLYYNMSIKKKVDKKHRFANNNLIIPHKSYTKKNHYGISPFYLDKDDNVIQSVIDITYKKIYKKLSIDQWRQIKFLEQRQSRYYYQAFGWIRKNRGYICQWTPPPEESLAYRGAGLTGRFSYMEK